VGATKGEISLDGALTQCLYLFIIFQTEIKGFLAMENSKFSVQGVG
jgi:hypothetical protein